MAEPIGPGDWVECVDASPVAGLDSGLVVGGRYQIEHLHDYLPHLGDPASTWFEVGVDLVGAPCPVGDLCWGLYRFRPIEGGALRSLLQPAPEVECV